MKKDQPHRFRPHLEPLEDRRMLAVSVQFDYSRDTGRLFSNAEAKTAFEETVTSITSRLNDTLLAITSSGSNRTTASYLDPGGNGGLQNINNFSIPANTLRIFAGSRNTGARVGFGGPGGVASVGSKDYVDRALDRGETGVRSSTDVGIWGGSISMNNTTNWYFGSAVSGVGDNQVDFRTVVAHELFHLLGYGIELTGATSSWEHLTRNGSTFLGQKARAANGGTFPAINGGHWATTTTSAGAPVLMAGVFDLNTPGVRISPTALDWAALDDLGWEVGSGLSTPTITDIDVSAGQPAATTSVEFEFVDINIGDRHKAAVNWGDGSQTNLDSVTTPFTVTHTYSAAGNYQAKVWVTDSTERGTSEEFTVTVGNAGGADNGGGNTGEGKAAPIIVSPGARTSLAGATSRIQFSFTDANSADTHSAAVDWGDGTALTQLDSVNGSFIASHKYTAAGTYTPIVWVTDSTLLSDRETFTMTVFGSATSPPTPPPTANIAAPVIVPPGNRTAIRGAEAKLTFEFSDANSGDTHSAAIDWGDGSALTQLDSVRSPFTVSHRYESTGTFKPKLWVTDSTRRSDREEFTMTIYPSGTKGNGNNFARRRAPYVVNPQMRTATAGVEISVTIGFSDPNKGDTHSAAINWGDGTPLTQLSSVTSPFIVRHTYASAGTYLPQVWVTDQGRLSHSQKFSMVVSNPPSSTPATSAAVDAVFETPFLDDQDEDE